MRPQEFSPSRPSEVSPFGSSPESSSNSTPPNSPPVSNSFEHEFGDYIHGDTAVDSNNDNIHLPTSITVAYPPAQNPAQDRARYAGSGSFIGFVRDSATQDITEITVQFAAPGQVSQLLANDEIQFLGQMLWDVRQGFRQMVLEDRLNDEGQAKIEHVLYLIQLGINQHLAAKEKEAETKLIELDELTGLMTLDDDGDAQNMVAAMVEQLTNMTI